VAKKLLGACGGGSSSDGSLGSGISIRAWVSDTPADTPDKIAELRASGDSAGGIVSCRVEGLPAGLGSPVFDKLDALISHAMLSLGAAKGIEFGSGFASARMKGSECNDPLVPRIAAPNSTYPNVTFASNNSGGVLGGISNGMALEFCVAFKPVPSISKEQNTVNRDGRARKLVIGGRHDICVCPRAVPVVEAMTALVLADLVLEQRAVTLLQRL
jgi:chorismate synthase